MDLVLRLRHDFFVALGGPSAKREIFVPSRRAEEDLSKTLAKPQSTISVSPNGPSKIFAV